MFDFPSLDEAALEDLKEIGAARTVAQRKEAMELFYTLSCDFRDAFSELEMVVLKPLWTSRRSSRCCLATALNSCGPTTWQTTSCISLRMSLPRTKRGPGSLARIAA